MPTSLTCEVGQRVQVLEIGSSWYGRVGTITSLTPVPRADLRPCVLVQFDDGHEEERVIACTLALLDALAPA